MTSLLQTLREQFSGATLVGIERSIKFSADGIAPNRFLAGFKTGNLTAASILKLQPALQIPKEVAARFESDLVNANQVGFGTEESTSGLSYKIYFEYWSEHLRNPPPAEQEPRILHIGYKWNPASPQQWLMSRYCCHPGISHDAIIARVDAMFRTAKNRKIAHIALSILRLAMKKCPDTRFIYSEVDEEGNNRNSFDVNLYPARLNLSAISLQMSRLLQEPGFDRFDFIDEYNALADCPLGHISGGIDRHGREFITVYYVPKTPVAK